MGKGKIGKILAFGAVVGAGAWCYKKYDTLKSMYDSVSLGKTERYEFDEVDGESVACVLSNVVIDLSESEFLDDEVYLDIYALKSKVTVIVSSDVELILEGNNKGSTISTDQNAEVNKNKTLFLNYDSYFSKILVTDDSSYRWSNDCDHGVAMASDCCCGETKESKMDFLKEKMHSAADVAKDLSATAKEKAGQIKEKASELAEKAKQKAKEVKNSGKEEVEEIGDEMMGIAEDGWEELKSGAKDLKQEVVDQADELRKEAGQKLDRAGEVIKDQTEKAKDQAEDLAEKAKDQAEEVAEEAKEWVEEETEKY